MAGVGLLALLDDIASLLDDVAAMSKVAARKTAGVLGDDLALNAEQVSGIASERELPVVFAVAMGSLKNKVILVPTAVIISALIPWIITPLLMCGGLFLCFEGMEKILHTKKAPKTSHVELNEIDLQLYEKEKIKGAIRTDFVLSAEIIVISLGVVSSANLITQFATLSIIAVVMTVGVYGAVAIIVKIDDLGFYLIKQKGLTLWAKSCRQAGVHLVELAPYLMKGLTVIGTIAMFMVGGGILSHGIHIVNNYITEISTFINANVAFFAAIPFLVSSVLQTILGLFAGIITVGLHALLPQKK